MGCGRTILSGSISQLICTECESGKVGTHLWDINVLDSISENFMVVSRSSVSNKLLTLLAKLHTCHTSKHHIWYFEDHVLSLVLAAVQAATLDPNIHIRRTLPQHHHLHCFERGNVLFCYTAAGRKVLYPRSD